MPSNDGEQLVRVKMYVEDGNSPLPATFLASAWSAYDILLAYMNLYSGDKGSIDADGSEWEGVWASPDCLAFAKRLIPEPSRR